MKWTPSKQTLRACAFLSLVAIASHAHAVSINVQPVTIDLKQQPVPTTVVVPVRITGGTENIGGLEFAFDVDDPSGHVTITDINLNPAGGLFAPQFANGLIFDAGTEFPPSEQVRPGSTPPEYSEGFHQIIRLSGFSQVNGTLPIANVTLKLTNPVAGTFALRASQTGGVGYVTRVLDDSADDAILNDLQIVNGAITILPVPEPSTLLMAGLAGLGMVAYGFRRRTAA